MRRRHDQRCMQRLGEVGDLVVDACARGGPRTAPGVRSRCSTAARVAEGMPSDRHRRRRGHRCSTTSTIHGSTPSSMPHAAASGSTDSDADDPSTVTTTGPSNPPSAQWGPTTRTGPKMRCRSSSATLPNNAADRPRPCEAITTVTSGWCSTSSAMAAAMPSSAIIAFVVTSTPAVSCWLTRSARRLSESAMPPASATISMMSTLVSQRRANAKATSAACHDAVGTVDGDDQVLNHGDPPC